ncbi:hypothetical protein MKW92_021861 [Papaver armeniacum]|nr:hypothetical protein MKW92_021861 [Papaver armeniacum]
MEDFLDHLYSAVTKILQMPCETDKLEGEADQAMVRKLLFKMTCDGYVEAESNPRLGSRVVRSESTVKKLIEVSNALGIKLSIFEPQNISTCACGGLCCVGSDLTRTREMSVDTHLNGSSRIQDQLGNNTPFRRNEHVGRVVCSGMISIREMKLPVVAPVRERAPGKLARYIFNPNLIIFTV